MANEVPYEEDTGDEKIDFSGYYRNSLESCLDRIAQCTPEIEALKQKLGPKLLPEEQALDIKRLAKLEPKLLPEEQASDIKRLARLARSIFDEQITIYGLFKQYNAVYPEQPINLGQDANGKSYNDDPLIKELNAQAVNKKGVFSTYIDDKIKELKQQEENSYNIHYPGKLQEHYKNIYTTPIGLCLSRIKEHKANIAKLKANTSAQALPNESSARLKRSILEERITICELFKKHKMAYPNEAINFGQDANGKSYNDDPLIKELNAQAVSEKGVFSAYIDDKINDFNKERYDYSYIHLLRRRLEIIKKCEANIAKLKVNTPEQELLAERTMRYICYEKIKICELFKQHNVEYPKQPINLDQDANGKNYNDDPLIKELNLQVVKDKNFSSIYIDHKVNELNKEYYSHFYINPLRRRLDTLAKLEKRATDLDKIAQSSKYSKYYTLTPLHLKQLMLHEKIEIYKLLKMYNIGYPEQPINLGQDANGKSYNDRPLIKELKLMQVVPTGDSVTFIDELYHSHIAKCEKEKQSTETQCAELYKQSIIYPIRYYLSNIERWNTKIDKLKLNPETSGQKSQMLQALQQEIKTQEMKIEAVFKSHAAIYRRSKIDLGQDANGKSYNDNPLIKELNKRIAKNGFATKSPMGKGSSWNTRRNNALFIKQEKEKTTVNQIRTIQRSNSLPVGLNSLATATQRSMAHN